MKTKKTWTICPKKVGHFRLSIGHFGLADTNYAEIRGEFMLAYNYPPGRPYRRLANLPPHFGGGRRAPPPPHHSRKAAQAPADDSLKPPGNPATHAERMSDLTALPAGLVLRPREKSFSASRRPPAPGLFFHAKHHRFVKPHPRRCSGMKATSHCQSAVVFAGFLWAATVAGAVPDQAQTSTPPDAPPPPQAKVQASQSTPQKQPVKMGVWHHFGEQDKQDISSVFSSCLSCSDVRKRGLLMLADSGPDLANLGGDG